jgi:hypothetical protein
VLSHANAPDGRPVRNSFVNHRVRNDAELIKHVQSDPVVADRYQRHFAMNRPTLLRYLGGLHRGTLARSGMYTIYSVPEGGRLKMHVGRIEKGEPMFLDRSGQPVLVVKCGNPVVLGPSRARHGNFASVTTGEESGSRRYEPKMPDPVGVESLVAMAPAVPMPAEPELATVPTGVAMPLQPSAPVATVPLGGSSSFSHLGSLLVMLPVVGSFQSAGDHTNPVPEPATLATLAVGALSVARRRRPR